MKKVLIPTKLEREARDVLQAHGHYTVVQDDKTDLLVLAQQHPDTHALIVRSEKIGPPVIDALSQLRVIVRAGSGYDTIDIQYARRKGIDVMNTPGANANAVAEEVVALMLADARHIVEADATTRAGQWEKKKYMGRELTGKTVGIVGLGNIGQLVAKRLSGFEVKLLGYDPLISQERADAIRVELTELPELFARADYVTLHIPENEDTRGLVNAALLGRMKEGATLVNCARAGILDEAALRAVKPARKLRFLNDVYPKDEAGPKSVTDLADLMLPHLGASTIEANANAARRAAEQLIELDDKGITSSIVNRDVPEGLDKAYGQLAFAITKLCRHLVGANAKLKTLEIGFHGVLEPFGDWLMLSVVKGLNDQVETLPNSKAARQYLKAMGIEVAHAAPEDPKGLENSITVGLTGTRPDSDDLRRVSVRGTVVEGVIMISRINEFDRLYFEPKGPTAFFIYEDRPGVLAQIGAGLAAAGINIEDVRNPHHLRLNQSLGIMQVNQPVPPAVIETISRNIKALASFHYDFGR